MTARDLLRLAGGEAYWRGLCSAIEGLAGRPKVRGDILFGRVAWCEMYRPRPQLVPPFQNNCSCPQGGNCRHVVTLGLTFLHEQRRKAGGVSFPPDESCYYQVALLEHETLRGLTIELLATLPDATEVAIKLLAPGRPADVCEQSLDSEWEGDRSGTLRERKGARYGGRRCLPVAPDAPTVIS